MNPEHRWLLAVGAIVDLLLGIVLLLSPAGVIRFLGLPPTDTFFYATILGGVLIGIGMALCLEWWGAPRGVRGLGLEGAAAIDLCGAGVLLYWLSFCGLELPIRSRVTLWVVAVGVLGIGVAEVAARLRRDD